MTICREFLELGKRPIESCDHLSEQTIWSSHGTAIWQANHFQESPSFYPVYRYLNYYSYSPLPLILFKGSLRVNPAAAQKIADPDFTFYNGSDTVDKEIVRLGGPPIPGHSIVDADSYAMKLAEAMCEDVAAVEVGHPNFTNIILCGGKDSLNLLLLPWKNPVIVASAPPNYELVKTFLANNNLSFKLVCLDDDDASLLDCEILANCCRNNLEHCRWGPHLKRLARTHSGQIILWKGQLGDILMTDYWRRFAYKYSPLPRPLRGRGNRIIRYVLERTNNTQRFAFNSLWSVGAMWQGAHNSILRQLTDALVLSGYHGPRVQKIWSQVDLKRAVQEDIRPLVGKQLLGERVVYPSTNPGPPPSMIRRGFSDLQNFIKVVRSTGIAVYE